MTAATVCRWFYSCTNEADLGFAYHTVTGFVPLCSRCSARVGGVWPTFAPSESGEEGTDADGVAACEELIGALGSALVSRHYLRGELPFVGSEDYWDGFRRTLNAARVADIRFEEGLPPLEARS